MQTTKIDFSKEFPLSRKGIIDQIKSKIRILTPKKETRIQESTLMDSPHTPKFNSTTNKKKYLNISSKRIKRMYDLQEKKRATSFYMDHSGESSKNSPRMKSSYLSRKL